MTPELQPSKAIEAHPDVGALSELFQFVIARNGSACVFIEAPEGRPGFTVQAQCDGPLPDSYAYLDSEIAGDGLGGCVREVLEELRAQEAADR